MENSQAIREIREPQVEMPKEYKPSKQEALGRYEINIQFMSRGCVIRVGCKSIPFSSTEEAIDELQKYFEYPYDTQERWSKELS
jgi:hypothetical protein